MNTQSDREIEMKYQAKADSLAGGIAAMKSIIEFFHYTTPGGTSTLLEAQALAQPFQDGSSSDHYFAVPDLDGDGSDFIRLRRNHSPKVLHTLTSKKTDQGDSVNREEINVSIARDEFHNTRKLLRTTMGPEVFKFVQEYALFRPDPSVHSLVVSVYTISISGIVFIEVEGPDLAIVEYWGSVIKPITQRQYKNSLWDLFNLGGL